MNQKHIIHRGSVAVGDDMVLRIHVTRSGSSADDSDLQEGVAVACGRHEGNANRQRQK